MARKQAVFVEYLMLAGVNDSEEQAELLADVLQPKRPPDLIPYNPTEADYQARAATPSPPPSHSEGPRPANRPPDPRPRHRRRLRPARC